MLLNEPEPARGRETWADYVRRFLPLLRDRDVDYVLWEMTPYPCWHPEEELERLARICAPVRKRGWYRKLWAEARRIDAEMTASVKAYATARAADAADPQVPSTGTLSTRD